MLSQSISITTAIPTVVGLDAGAITLNGPSGLAIALGRISVVSGGYYSKLPDGAISSSGGTFTFKGSGGSQVGPFTATLSFPTPLLNWTNESAAASIVKTQGLPVTWSGGGPGTYVIVSGNADSGGIFGSYTCIVPVEAGQFTVPSYILLGLPAGTGSTTVETPRLSHRSRQPVSISATRSAACRSMCVQLFEQ